MPCAPRIVFGCALWGLLAGCREPAEAVDDTDSGATDTDADAATTTGTPEPDGSTGETDSTPAPVPDTDTDTDAAPDDGGPWMSLDDRPCPPDSFLTYENFGGPYILSYCNACHGSGVPDGSRQGAPVTVTFDSLEQIRTLAPRIWARSADQNATMPPAGAPDELERALLGEWLACGAPADSE